MRFQDSSAVLPGRIPVKQSSSGLCPTEAGAVCDHYSHLSHASPRNGHAKVPASRCHRLGFLSLTKALGVENFAQVVGSQGVHCQDAFIRKAPLAARDKSCQELAICRNVTAGIIVDFAVLHQHIHGGCIRQRRKKG